MIWRAAPDWRPSALRAPIEGAQHQAAPLSQLPHLGIGEEIVLGSSCRRADEGVVAGPRVDRCARRCRKAWMNAEFEGAGRGGPCDQLHEHASGHDAGIEDAEKVVGGA